MMQVCRGKVWSRALAVTGGGYKRRLQTAVTNGSYVVSETEMKPKRNRNETTSIWVGMRCPGPMYWAMVGGGVRGGVGGVHPQLPARIPLYLRN